MKYVYGGVALVIVLVGTFATVKKVSPLSWGWWGTTNTAEGLALKGYDPVEYLNSAAATPGNNAHTSEWGDATWYFSTAANRDLFASDPERYTPRYGSFCAFAASKGFTADSDPEAWYVHDDRLYVFADKNVRDQWVDGLADGSLEASDANWAKR